MVMCRRAFHLRGCGVRAVGETPGCVIYIEYTTLPQVKLMDIAFTPFPNRPCVLHPIPDTARRRHRHHRIRDLEVSGYRPIGNDLTRKSARG